ncbi:hypothetical protein A9G25_07220 [Gilliamella sp. Bif1-4]|nr:hypothetical protein A9G25_07220 [Gilliamella apicola]
MQNALCLALPFEFKSFHCKSHFAAKITVLAASLKRKLTKLTLFLLLQLAMVNSVHAILTAISSHFIVGNAPEVVALTSADKQGFTVYGIFYSEASNNIKSDEIKELMVT